MVNKGIASERISYSGHSEEKPVGSNKTEIGRAINRRVEIELENEFDD
jgi:outer membrane protein OmpA-like peptidoglycan-associated protein